MVDWFNNPPITIFMWAWVVIGILILSQFRGISDKKHPFFLDFIGGLILILLWPILPLLQKR